MNTYEISLGSGTRTAKGKDLQSAFASLGYTGFKVFGNTIEVPGAPGHERKYYARIIAGVHNGVKFCDDELKEGDLAINIEYKKSVPMRVVRHENGVLGFDLLKVNPVSWFHWAPLRKKHKKVVE